MRVREEDGILEAIRTLWGEHGADPSGGGGVEVCVLFEPAAAGDAKSLFVRMWSGGDGIWEGSFLLGGCAELVCEVIRPWTLHPCCGVGIGAGCLHLFHHLSSVGCVLCSCISAAWHMQPCLQIW